VTNKEKLYCEHLGLVAVPGAIVTCRMTTKGQATWEIEFHCCGGCSQKVNRARSLAQAITRAEKEDPGRFSSARARA